MTKPRLPTDPTARKAIALSLVFDYFGDALCEVAEIIMAGQVQHNTTGWDRTKSTDHADCLLRHFLDRGTLDVDGKPHTAKGSWRHLAMHQLEVEARKGLPPPRGVSVPADKRASRIDNVRIEEGVTITVDADGYATIAPTVPEARELDPGDPELQASWRRHIEEHIRLFDDCGDECGRVKGHKKPPTQLELPFTGKQRSLKELTHGDIGKAFRVIDGPKDATTVGTVIVLKELGRISDAVFDDGYTYFSPSWRFELA